MRVRVRVEKVALLQDGAVHLEPPRRHRLLDLDRLEVGARDGDGWLHVEAAPLRLARRAVGCCLRGVGKATAKATARARTRARARARARVRARLRVRVRAGTRVRARVRVRVRSSTLAPLPETPRIFGTRSRATWGRGTGADREP